MLPVVQVAVQQRLAAFAAVLGSTLTDSQGRVAAYEPLPRLAVSFVAVNLKVNTHTHTGGCLDSGSSRGVLDECRVVLCIRLGKGAVCGEILGGGAAQHTCTPGFALALVSCRVAHVLWPVMLSFVTHSEGLLCAAALNLKSNISGFR